MGWIIYFSGVLVVLIAAKLINYFDKPASIDLGVALLWSTLSWATVVFFGIFGIIAILLLLSIKISETEWAIKLNNKFKE